jgi:hypothetical protein
MDIMWQPWNRSTTFPLICSASWYLTVRRELLTSLRGLRAEKVEFDMSAANAEVGWTSAKTFARNGMNSILLIFPRRGGETSGMAPLWL